MQKLLNRSAIVVACALVIYFLSFVFKGSFILSQTFKVGPLVIHYYGLIMALAVAAGFYLAIKRAASYGLDKIKAENILFWALVGGFVGARLYHVFSSLAYYQSNPADILKVWNGGLSIYGAIIGGLIALIFLEKILNLKSEILNLLSWLTPSLIVGQIIGRFGNLFNYEAFGYPTNLPWKMFVPEQFRPENYQSFSFFHPWFLYEQIGLLVILFVISKLENRQKGSLFIWYLLLYNTLRFGLEFLRIDSTFIQNIRLNALVSLLLIVIASAILMRNKNAKTS